MLTAHNINTGSLYTTLEETLERWSSFKKLLISGVAFVEKQTPLRAKGLEENIEVSFFCFEYVRTYVASRGTADLPAAVAPLKANIRSVPRPRSVSVRISPAVCWVMGQSSRETLYVRTLRGLVLVVL